MWHLAQGLDPGTGNAPLPRARAAAAPPRLLELAWHLPPPVRAGLAGAEARLDRLVAATDIVALRFTAFGKREMKRWKISPDACLQAAFQRVRRDSAEQTFFRSRTRCNAHHSYTALDPYSC